jgi:hypothetical protein
VSSPSAAQLARWNVPWAYESPKHYNHESLVELCREEEIPLEFVPFASYCLSGVVYSSIALSHTSQEHEPMIYVAAPGRITALEQILSSSELSTIGTPKSAYEELATEVDLPQRGLTFHHMYVSLPPAESSPMVDKFMSMPPLDALRLVCKMRMEPQFIELRRIWPSRRTSHGAAVDAGLPTQNVENTIVHGDLTMVISSATE